MVQIHARRRITTLRLERWKLASIAVIIGVLHTVLIRAVRDDDSSGGGDLSTLRPIPAPEKKPLFVLHVGPPKTGTTSLQHMIESYESQLFEDNYFSTGNASFIDSFNVCTRRVRKAGRNTECWSKLNRTLEAHRSLGHNVILSNEMISVQAQAVDYWELIVSLLDPWMPNVLVVVGYRHLHNFLPSTHYELQKNQRWPSSIERGKSVTPFVKFWNQNHGRDLLGPIPTPATVIKQFRAAQYNVSVLDIETKEQIREFFCRILPDAARTCQHHQSQPPVLHLLNTNDKGQVNYDSLAIIAFTRHYLKKDQTRKYVRSRVKEFNEKGLKRGPNDFPLTCLTLDQQIQFLEESITHARSAGFSNMENDVRVDFAKTKDKRKFCSINATVAFEDPIWTDFFMKAKTEW